MLQFNSIQYRHLHAPTYKLSRWRARRIKIIKKKVSFQFSFKTVQRKIRVTQMHWECVPGCGRSKVESALHCGGQAEYLHDLTHNRCSAVIAAILVILIRMLFNVEKQSWLYLRMYISIPKQSIVSIITHILIF